MPSAPDSQGPAHFHPEFGYLCPTPPTRRLIRVASIAVLCGLALGAVGVFSLQARPPANVIAAPTATEDAGPVTVGTRIPEDAAKAIKSTSSPTPPASDKPCSKQTWPFLDRKCLGQPQGKSRYVRVIAPEGPIAPDKSAVPEQTTSLDQPSPDIVKPEVGVVSQQPQPPVSKQPRKKVAQTKHGTGQRSGQGGNRRESNPRTVRVAPRQNRNEPNVGRQNPHVRPYDPGGHPYVTARNPQSYGFFGWW